MPVTWKYAFKNLYLPASFHESQNAALYFSRASYELSVEVSFIAIKFRSFRSQKIIYLYHSVFIITCGVTKLDCTCTVLVSPLYLLVLGRKLYELSSTFGSEHKGELAILLMEGHQRLLLCNTQVILPLAFKLWFITYLQY